MSKKIEMTHEFIESIVILELKESLELNLEKYGHEQELIDALKCVLAYYMPLREYDSYIEQLE